MPYNKIQDGRRPPCWKLKNRHNSAAIRDISTKIGLLMKLLILLSRQVSFTKSKMADDHHIGKIRIAIISPPYEITLPNLLRK